MPTITALMLSRAAELRRRGEPGYAFTLERLAANANEAFTRPGNLLASLKELRDATGDALELLARTGPLDGPVEPPA